MRNTRRPAHHVARTLLAAALLPACLPTCEAESTPCTTDGDCAFVQACQDGTCRDGALAAALPELPPEEGTPSTAARVITDPADLVTGSAAQGRLGDVVMQNNVSRFIIQKGGRDWGVAPMGGNVIDAVALVNGEPLPDEFGEASPSLNLGNLVDFERVEVVRSGLRGGPAVVRAYGRPAIWDTVNLAGFLGDGFSTAIPFDPDEPLDLKVVATYVLMPGEPLLRVTYTVLNQRTLGIGMPVGLVVDSGGEVEFFRSNGGFGTPSYNASAILDAARPVPWFGFQGKQSSSAIRPRPVVGDVAVDSLNPTVQVAGVTVSLFSRPDVLAALGDSDFFLRPGEAASFGYDLAVADNNLGAAGAALWAAQGKATRTLTVTVVEEGGTTPVPGALVVIRNRTNQGNLAEPVTTFHADVSGTARVVVPAGADLVVQVRADGRTAPEARVVAPAEESITITTGRPGALSYRLLRADDLGSSLLVEGACRITVVGAEQVPDEVVRGSRNDRPPAGIAALRYSPTCTSALDGPIPLQPGRYLVIASAGPFHDVVQQLVDVSANSDASFTGTLHRITDTGGYVASDWHQHAVNSPDAPVGLRERLLGYLAEGIEMFGGSDHDYFTDWENIVVDMGFGDRLQAVNGVEATTFDYGHFNMFPVTPDPAHVNFGAVDWGGGAGPGLSPPQLWQRYRDLGVQVVQVNHPFSGLSGYFERSAMTFEVDRVAGTGVVRGDPGRQPVPNEKLRLPPMEPLWSAEFDAVELYNGMSPYSGAPITRKAGDRKVDRILSQVATLIHVGHQPVMTGTSDTHRINRGDHAYPRTYVHASRRPDGRVDPWSVLGALAGRGSAPNRGNVVVSNAPLAVVKATAGTSMAVPGGLLRASGTFTVDVEVQAPTWMELTQADIVLSPINDAQQFPENDPPFMPEHITALTATDTVLVNGGTRRTWRASITVDLAAENPFPGKDAFLVARVYGRTPMWPVVFENASLQVNENAATVEDFAQATDGVWAYAVTNPLYVDVDGDGRFRAPFAP